MNDKFLAIAKKATSLVVGLGVSKIVAGIIENNVSAEKVTDKVAITAASYTLGFAISDYTSEYTDEKWDAFADWYDKFVANRSN